MTYPGSFYHEPGILLPLVEKSDLLKLQPNGRIAVPEKLPQPLDEYEIPKRIELIQTALGTAATDHVWTGEYDLHHLAYHESTYKSITFGEERIGSRYRGSSKLKVIVPRQLHDYLKHK